MMLSARILPIILFFTGFSCHYETSLELADKASRYQSCKACHLNEWNEWYQTPHAQAWQSDVVQAAFHNFGFSRKCQSCHAPEPVLVTGLKNSPVLRDDSLASGVNCVTCHGLEGVGVAAAHDNSSAFCKPVAVASISTSQFCGTCHAAIFEDWVASRYSSEGKTCLECHMRDPSTGEFSHLCTNLLTVEKYSNSIEMRCFQEGGQIIALVTNNGVGHNFPGERHNRTLSLNVIQRDLHGDVQSAQKELIKGITPFRGESTEEKIKIDETVRYHFPVEISDGAIEVKLLLKRFPWLSDEESTIVASSQISL